MKAETLAWLALIPFVTACQPEGGPAPADDVSPDDASRRVASPGAAGPAPDPTRAPTPAEPRDPITPADRLEGEYRIAGVDDGDINLPHGITASISEDRIDVTSQCVEMAWSYRLEGATLQTTRIPVVTCDRGRYPEEEAIDAAFTAAQEVERTASNGLRFSGGGRSVTLFTQ